MRRWAGMAVNKYVLSFLMIVFSITCLPGCRSTPSSDKTRLDRIEHMYREYLKEFPDIPDLSVRELLTLQETENVILVDEREPKEWRVSMLPGAVTREAFEREIESYRHLTVVVYCTAGKRSGYYTVDLAADGFKAFNLEGGVLAWAHAGRPFVKNGKNTRRVHVYGEQWNLLPEEYEAVW
ncbi:MAG: rhodanese-like domain-containing protein [bacterium]|nr:rhodanese-like domain-containing protein [bacterium]